MMFTRGLHKGARSQDRGALILSVVFLQCMAKDLHEIILSFRHTEDGKVSKPAPRRTPVRAPRSNYVPSKRLLEHLHLADLAPSIREHLTVVFIGFNPGVQSSVSQHHYAHPTNLFWRLFNDLGICGAVVDNRRRIDGGTSSMDSVGRPGNNGDARHVADLEANGASAETDSPEGSESGTRANGAECGVVGGSRNSGDDVEASRVRQEVFDEKGNSHAQAKHDYRLVHLGIGFTDLVLRCTRQALGLSMQEKLAGVPRLFAEFNRSQAPYLVFIGKGIWETFCRYWGDGVGGFQWGLQTGASARKFWRHCSYQPQVYVFPSTSGLVALMKYAEKLALWMELSRDVLAHTGGDALSLRTLVPNPEKRE